MEKEKLNMVHDFRQDWVLVASMFEQMFDGLGVLSITENLLTFRSVPPSVATGISITRSGALVANMPLHAIESVFETVAFSSDLTSLTLAGDGSSYTYTVPPALLSAAFSLMHRRGGSNPSFR